MDDRTFIVHGYETLLGRPPDAERLRRRRAAYQAFLWKRLKAPRPFVG